MADKPKTFEESPTSGKEPKTMEEPTKELPPQNSGDVDNPAVGNVLDPGDPAAHEGIAPGEDTHPLATGLQDGIAGETEQEEAERLANYNQRVMAERNNQFDTRGNVAEAKALNGGISPKAFRVNEQKMERRAQLDAMAENNREAEAELKAGGPAR